MKKVLYIPALTVLVLLGASSCKVRKALEQSPLFPISDNAILDQVLENSVEFETLNGKVDVVMKTAKETLTFSMNLRIAHDSIIWMSLSPALGIEAARIVVRPDTLLYINKLQNTYYAGGFSLMDSLLQYEAGYSFIENILVGNPVEIEPQEKYTSITDELYYVIQTKVKRKLKKSVDIGIKQSPTDSTYGDILKEKKFIKATEKLGEEDLIVKRYYIGAGSFKVARTYLEDLLYLRSVRIYYDEYQEVSGRLIPHKIMLEISTPQETATFELRYTRVRLDEPQSYPFRIPESFAPIH